ncbi:hypothetical protein [Sandaracinus amylolyticus]|uniref:Uncharacterized protein n=1 Tax=Sandaracinus amylolyticus TaxID=927083 RepID=A0A0F6SHT7_9BACT|nr:hypothetical protein [Sandaracinus amylolyticus]AKF11014.1 hypothetical protein DB32_008163 [Sandaracinus amylolyticus]
MRRERLLALSGALACCVVGCGGSGGPASATAAQGTLGVQSNTGGSEVTLRMAPSGPMTFATQLRVTVRSEMLGQPINADMDTRGVRRVVERRPDGSLAIEEMDTASTFAFSMMGRSRSGPEHAGPAEPRRYVLGDRGRRLDEPATLAVAPATPGGGFERVMDPLVRALEFPVEAISPGATWSAQGRIPLDGVDAGLAGEARYQLVQRLERLEGSGDERVAVIAFEGSLEGEGESVAPPAPAMPGEPELPAEAMRGALRFRGFYVVALSDGFARSARAEFEGEAQLGPGGLMTFPLEGELEWLASPIDATLEIREQEAASAAPVAIE